MCVKVTMQTERPVILNSDCCNRPVGMVMQTFSDVNLQSFLFPFIFLYLGLKTV
jgi:hypothetical protein